MKRTPIAKRKSRAECLLCACDALWFYTGEATHKHYFHCRQCDLRFLDQEARLPMDDEFNRYLCHNEDPNHPGYHDFVLPLLELVKAKVAAPATGLDYGCGRVPAFAEKLRSSGYQMDLFDPFFFPDAKVWEATFDFVCAVEVVEHFYWPVEEFARLKTHLKENGFLFIMTALVTEQCEFASWSYRRDPTHVCFYSEKTMSWIQKKYKFKGFGKFGERCVYLRT